MLDGKILAELFLFKLKFSVFDLFLVLFWFLKFGVQWLFNAPKTVENKLKKV